MVMLCDFSYEYDQLYQIKATTKKKGLLKNVSFESLERESGKEDSINSTT